MYIMKIDHVLRKAAPFLLIAILIACLFSMPQKEGMKNHAKHFFEKNHYKNTKIIGGTAAGATVLSGLGAAAVTYGPAMFAAKGGGATEFAAKDDGGFTDDLAVEPSRTQRLNRETLYRIGGEQRTADEFIKGGDYSPEAWDMYSSLPERSSLGIISDGKHVRFADEIGEPIAHTAEDVSSSAAKYDDPMKDLQEFRASNLRADEQGVKDFENPSEFVSDIAKNPGEAAEWAVEHPEYDVD